MCLVSVNSIADEQLDDLSHSKDKNMIEKRLYNFAKDANKKIPGALDNPKNSMKGMPNDLKEIRKHRIGRHRIFYTGHHTQCSYQAIFIKKFKKSDKDQESSTKFHKKLRSALQEPTTRKITDV